MKSFSRALIVLVALAIIATTSLLPVKVFDYNGVFAAVRRNAPAQQMVPQAVPSPWQAQIEAERLYHEAWKVVDDNFVYRDRLKDWHTWEHRYDGKLKNEADAVKAINEMLGSLKETYTYYKSPSAVKADNDRSAKTSVVSSKMLAGDVGYIKITTFSSEHTAQEVEAALKALSGAKAYVIDLRDNGGGFVRQSFEVFSLFVDSGTYTVMSGYKGGNLYKEEHKVTSANLESNENGTLTVTPRRANLAGGKPVIILVNGGTASASEMLSGALHDNGRATVIGTKTFGKGIAQIAPELSNGGAVRVTFANYKLPKGSSIHKIGITPDKVVDKSATGDAQLDEGIKFLEKELKK